MGEYIEDHDTLLHEQRGTKKRLLMSDGIMVMLTKDMGQEYVQNAEDMGQPCQSAID